MSSRPEPTTIHHLLLTASPNAKRSPLNDPPHVPPASMPVPREVKHHDSAPLEDVTGGDTNIEKARLAFVGTATCVLEW